MYSQRSTSKSHYDFDDTKQTQHIDKIPLPTKRATSKPTLRETQTMRTTQQKTTQNDQHYLSYQNYQTNQYTQNTPYSQLRDVNQLNDLSNVNQSQKYNERIPFPTATRRQSGRDDGNDSDDEVKIIIKKRNKQNVALNQREHYESEFKPKKAIDYRSVVFRMVIYPAHHQEKK